MDIPESWTFKSKEVADNFDSHVREQLPWYDLATGAVEHIARQYLPANGIVYDIGASTGNINLTLSDLIKERGASYVGIESSKEMVDKFKGDGDIVHADATVYEYRPFDVCVCFLTLMFIPYSEQANFIRLLRSKIKDGGVLIVVDKCEPVGGYAATVLYKLSLREKMKHSKSCDILRKELSLSGIQRPVNADALKEIGVEFFRFGDFAGWIIEKEDHVR